MRGLKLFLWEQQQVCQVSHLLQMRGLKQPDYDVSTVRQKSHLLQMRGLKPASPCWFVRYSPVASFTDAWIETYAQFKHKGNFMSHLLQMRGLKQSAVHGILLQLKSHLLQMRGLKQNGTYPYTVTKSGRIFYRCVD